jgi:hypothetical protein
VSWRTRIALLRPGRVVREAARDGDADEERFGRLLAVDIDSGSRQIAQFWTKRL